MSSLSIGWWMYVTRLPFCCKRRAALWEVLFEASSTSRQAAWPLTHDQEVLEDWVSSCSSSRFHPGLTQWLVHEGVALRTPSSPVACTNPSAWAKTFCKGSGAKRCQVTCINDAALFYLLLKLNFAGEMWSFFHDITFASHRRCLTDAVIKGSSTIRDTITMCDLCLQGQNKTGGHIEAILHAFSWFLKARAAVFQHAADNRRRREGNTRV